MATMYERAAAARWLAGLVMFGGLVFLALPGGTAFDREDSVTWTDIQRLESTLDMARREAAGERLTPFEQNRRRNDPASVEELEARLAEVRGKTRTRNACREVGAVGVLGGGLALILAWFVRRQWPDEPDPEATGPTPDP